MASGMALSAAPGSYAATLERLHREAIEDPKRLAIVTELDGEDPQVKVVHEAPTRGCATPVVVGHYWIQAYAPDRRVFVLDVSDLKNVRQVL